MPQNTPATLCPTCGGPISPNAPFGQCPRCLLGFASGTGLDRDLPGDDLIVAGQKRSIAGYELIEEIARGGMGIVYRARQLTLGREVALKMLASGDLASEDAVQRFRNEASAAASLDHPNIVPVYEIGEEETGHYFSMRFVPGRRNVADWARALQVEGRSRSIASMMARIAHALAYAHERGVLHRDLKPSNLLIDENDEPQVTDFGLARLYREVDSGLTLTRQILGSPSYMAPEQAEGRRADETTLTDVYGLGAVLYEMLSGRPPFLADSPIATARKVVEERPPRLPSVNRDLETICLKCLEKEPGRRYHGALDLAEDLERFARGEPIRARPITVPESLWRWVKRRPRTAALAGAFLLALLLGLAGVTFQWLRAERVAAHLRWLEIVRQAEDEETPLALARLARKLREDPQHWEAAMLAMSVVDQKSFPVLAGPPVEPATKLVTEPCLSADGDWFAAGAEDGSLSVWDTGSGRPRRALPLGSRATTLAAGSGSFVLAVGTVEGRRLLFTDLEKPPMEVTSAAGGVLELAFSGDGAVLFSRGKNEVELWRGRERIAMAFTLGGDPVDGASLSFDGSRLLVWGKQKAVVFDTATSTPLRVLAPRSAFRQGHLCADGSRVALIDGSYAIRSWETDSGIELATLDSGVAQWKRLLFNRDGSRLVAMGTSNDLVLFDPVSGLPAAPPMRHLYMPTRLVSSGDGRRFASCGDDGRAIVWDADTGRMAVEAVWNDTNLETSISLNRDGSRLLVFPPGLRSGEPSIAVWKPSMMRPPRLQRVSGARDLFATSLSPDGTLAALGLNPDLRSHVYEVATGRVVLDVPTRGPVYAHLFSPDQKRYYALTANGWLHGWSLETGAELWAPAQQPGKIRPAAISPDGTRIVAGHNDGHLRVYDTATGRQIDALDHPGEIKVVRFAHDGSGRFLSGSTDHFAHVWDVASGKKLATLGGHGNTIIAAAWSADGRLVATASFDQTARVWDAATGQALGEPMSHLAWLSHLEFSPDGTRLATACRDGSVRLWHPRTGRPASSPLPLGSTAVTVRFTSDSRTLVAQDHLGFRWFGVERAEPISVRYLAPISNGIGLDSESLRSLLTPDGRGVFLGHSMNEGQFWTVPQPRGEVPAWFPDFLEALSGIVEVKPGDLRIQPSRRATDLVPGSDRDEFAEWARGILK